MTSIDMTPASAALNGAYMSLVNSVVIRNNPLTAGICSDGSHNIGRDLRRMMVGAAPVSALGRHILVVGVSSPQEKMRFVVAARRVVAPMQDAKTGRNGANECLVDCARREGSGFARARFSVTALIAPSGPRPAGVRATGAVNVVIQSLCRRPVVGAPESLYGVGSHLPAPFQRRMVRVGVRVRSAAQLANYGLSALAHQPLGAL